MMNVNFNRLHNYLLILLCLITAGCTSTSKEPVNLADLATNTAEAENSDEQNQNARNRLKFNKSKSTTSQHNTVWDRLLSLYSLPEMDNARINEEIEWYLDHPATLAIIQQRAEPYLHHILDEVEAKNIPGELALLPVVESAFVPDAYSKADASGLWQFVPSTGEEYGLEQNAWYDGRRDVYASTQAATTYLKELSETFDGDWLLALASYNCGKGRVRKSIEYNENHNLPTDYWSLNLPQETLDYVPKLLAVAKIFANAEEYNLHLQHIPNKPYFEPVNVNGPLDLHKAAQLANTPYDKFVKLNPGFSRSCTAPQGSNRLLIPIAQVQSFKKNLAELPYDERYDEQQLHPINRPINNRPTEIKVAEAKPDYSRQVTFYSYKVKHGETLSSIAERTHTTIVTLKAANHLKGNTVKYGEMLQIPGTSNKAINTLLVAKSKAAPIGNQVYAIKKGDTFWNISQRFSVSPNDIAEWNKITLKTALVPGRKLTIKSNNQQIASSSPSIRLVQYTVGKGDSLTKIAKRFNVSVDDLRKSNPTIRTKAIVSGQKLKVVVDNQPST